MMTARIHEPHERSGSPGQGAQPLSFIGAYQASRMERVVVIREGLPALALVETGRAMGISNEKLYSILHLPRATATRKISTRSLLSPEASERVLGLYKLIGQVQVMVQESGNPEGFNAAEWLAKWLDEPSPALGGQKPGDLLDTSEGQEIVSGVLSQMQSGAYA
ncbi:MAG: antitoxin Xre-like helix-turn-helix domain-containing protein [Candidatus Accumulibacter sp. UW20]